MNNLYEVTGEFKRIEEMIIDGGGEVTEEIEEALNTSTLAVKDKVKGILTFLRNLDSDVEAIDKEIKRLTVLKKTRKNAYGKLKDWSKLCMEAHELKKIDTPLGGLAIQKNPPSVEVINRDDIPASYIITTQTESVDKAQILKDLKAGKVISGCRLVTDKTNLRIK